MARRIAPNEGFGECRDAAVCASPTRQLLPAVRFQFAYAVEQWALPNTWSQNALVTP
jgi:hypothetical protein